MTRAECDQPSGSVDRWCATVFHPLGLVIRAQSSQSIGANVEHEDMPQQIDVFKGRRTLTFAQQIGGEGTRFDASETKVANRPSPLIAGS